MLAGVAKFTTGSGWVVIILPQLNLKLISFTKCCTAEKTEKSSANKFTRRNKIS